MGTHSSVNIMMPADISELFRSEGPHPRRMTLQPWATHRETRQYSKGVFLKSVTVCIRVCVSVALQTQCTDLFEMGKFSIILNLCVYYYYYLCWTT